MLTAWHSNSWVIREQEIGSRSRTRTYNHSVKFYRTAYDCSRTLYHWAIREHRQKHKAESLLIVKCPNGLMVTVTFPFLERPHPVSAEGAYVLSRLKDISIPIYTTSRSSAYPAGFSPLSLLCIAGCESECRIAMNSVPSTKGERFVKQSA